MNELKENFTIEDLINIWICMERHIFELLKTDKKAAEDISKTYNKFLKLPITLTEDKIRHLIEIAEKD